MKGVAEELRPKRGGFPAKTRRFRGFVLMKTKSAPHAFFAAQLP
jgi:hypothetical protein